MELEGDSASLLCKRAQAPRACFIPHTPYAQATCLLDKIFDITKAWGVEGGECERFALRILERTRSVLLAPS